jgi:glucose/arabinose dehydrogenase
MRRGVSTFGLAGIAVIAWALPAMAQVPSDLELVQIASGLSEPLTARHAGDGSGRLFILERAGRIAIYDGAGVLTTRFLDISGPVDSSDSEQGLLGLAFDPDYASNGFFYVNYIYDPGAGLDRTRVSRFNVSAGDPNVADPNSEAILLEIAQDYSNHNGGNILFGPDGYLYIGMGDGGSTGDPNNRAQTLTQLLGKMLRIDVHSAVVPPGADVCGLVSNYGIPATNPYAGSDGACDEIWASGLRNPWRWSFDRATGDLFIGDVGQGTWEEVDMQPAASPGGENWGWRCYEGNDPYNTSACLAIGNYDFPILQYDSTASDCAVVGGYRYRGSITGFVGTYVYGDSCTGKIWFANESGGPWSSSEWMNTSFSVSSFGEDEAGELYVVDLGGTISRFEAPSLFADGFETGTTENWSTTFP